MGFPVGIYKAGKLVKILDSNAPEYATHRDWDRKVDLSRRPDIALGHVWGTEPEGYGVTYRIEDGKIVQIDQEQS